MHSSKSNLLYNNIYSYFLKNESLNGSLVESEVAFFQIRLGKVILKVTRSDRSPSPLGGAKDRRKAIMKIRKNRKNII